MPGKTNICITVCDGEQYATIYLPKKDNYVEIQELLRDKIIFVWDSAIESKLVDIHQNYLIDL